MAICVGASIGWWAAVIQHDQPETTLQGRAIKLAKAYKTIMWDEATATQNLDRWTGSNTYQSGWTMLEGAVGKMSDAYTTVVTPALSALGYTVPAATPLIAAITTAVMASRGKKRSLDKESPEPLPQQPRMMRHTAMEPQARRSPNHALQMELFPSPESGPVYYHHGDKGPRSPNIAFLATPSGEKGGQIIQCTPKRRLEF